MVHRGTSPAVNHDEQRCARTAQSAWYRPCKALHHARRRRERCLVPTPLPEPGSGRLMEEPMLNRRYFTLSLAGLAVLAAFLAPGALAPAQADGIRTFNCVGGR